MFNKQSMKVALFTGLFVFIAMSLIEFSTLDINIFITALIAGLSALVGSWLGNKLFPS